jgi:disulfide bond formation protein DsbB
MVSLGHSHRTVVRTQAYRGGAVVLFGAAAVILAALGFEHLGGYLPCPLCLQQRYAYYVGIPLTFLALVFMSSGQARWGQLLFALVAVGFFTNTGLGIYQAGAEWKFWPGPNSCGTLQAIGGAGRGVLETLGTTKVIRCDEAQWRLAGLSFAGWNAVVSLLLALLASKSALACAVPQRR